jgi:hypothetical protein
VLRKPAIIRQPSAVTHNGRSQALSLHFLRFLRFYRHTHAFCFPRAFPGPRPRRC